MELHVLGIRHHGPGSARYVLDALEALKPDCILIEGPPDADSIIAQAASDQMETPVAILVYNIDTPKQASFYPFALFSPEWVAMQYALKHQLKVRFMDLPLSIVYAQDKAFEINKVQDNKQPASESKENIPKENSQPIPNQPSDESLEPSPDSILDKNDELKDELLEQSPIGHLAKIAGYDDTDLWWEHHFEQVPLPNTHHLHFEAVSLAMNSLRETFDESPHNDLFNQQREAYMRHIIRETQLGMYERVAVVCGAWHAPSLHKYNDIKCEKSDKVLLKKLPKALKTAATWMPWTYGRLSMKSGYGAGITSPGWYEHVWLHPTDRYGHRWLSRVAQLLREKNMDISTAHVIEAARLVEALAAMRNLARPGLAEMNEATQSVICFGDALYMQLVDKELIVSEKIGKVPDNLPKPPIQIDFEQKIKSLRLQIVEYTKEITLDLRNDTDLSRSRFLFSTWILKIPWAKLAHSRSKGTFKEAWRLAWKPEILIQIIEMGLWGNTIEEAATKYLSHLSQMAQSIKVISDLISQAIPAALYAAIDQLKDRLDELAAIGTDIHDLLASIAPLASITRYGDVRQTDSVALLQVIEKLMARVCIGLSAACYSLDEKTAATMYQHIRIAHDALSLLDNPNLKEQWYAALREIADSPFTNALIAGCATRLLFDAQQFDESETATRFARVLSIGNSPEYTAAWLEGFLKNSGELILYDNLLWNILHKWVCELPEEAFIEQLPILRRTFASFEPTQRRWIGEKAAQTIGSPQQSRVGVTETVTQRDTFDVQRAEQVLPMVWLLLGK